MAKRILEVVAEEIVERLDAMVMPLGLEAEDLRALKEFMVFRVLRKHFESGKAARDIIKRTKEIIEKKDK